MVQGFAASSYLLMFKTFVSCIYQQMMAHSKYICDSFKEIDISELAPGEVLQTTWNGELIFIRRLT